jgi:hypothetical protein
MVPPMLTKKFKFNYFFGAQIPIENIISSNMFLAIYLNLTTLTVNKEAFLMPPNCILLHLKYFK